MLFPANDRRASFGARPCDDNSCCGQRAEVFMHVRGVLFHGGRYYTDQLFLGHFLWDAMPLAVDR
jgi:hypothetical protein